MCASVESTLAGVDVDAVSGTVVIQWCYVESTLAGVDVDVLHLLMCASESTLAGVDVDAVSGTVVIYLLMCVLVLNQC